MPIVEPRAESKSRRGGWLGSFGRSFVRRPKIYFSMLAGVCIALLLPSTVPGSARAAAAWNGGGLVYLAMAFQLMRSCKIEDIRKRAAREDEQAIVFLMLILLASAASFMAPIALIGDAKAAKGSIGGLYVGLAGLTILVSWAVTQIVFTLHYAHLYYQPAENGKTAGGLKFPEDDHPDYADFFYFTTSIGATSQTSDVAITSKKARRLASIHAIISFFFNTTILALAINLAAGLI